MSIGEDKKENKQQELSLVLSNDVTDPFKRESVTTEVDVLKPGQKKALNEMLEWFKGFETGYILKGFAGTGKTWTTREFIRALINIGVPKSKIVMCAPTNKAVKVQTALDTGLTTCTIYSLLGLRMEAYEDTMKLIKSERSKDDKYRIVILDESSMINSELYGYIKASMARGVRYLFIGDPKQINPIGERRSPIWSKFRYSKLTEPVRHDNQIFRLATAIRKSKNVYDLEFRSDNDGREGVWYLPNSKFEDKLRRYAKSGQFDERARAIAWQNKTVRRMNNWVREEIFGERQAEVRFHINDQILFTAPHKIELPSGAEINIHTDDDAIIRKITVHPHQYYPALRCYYLDIDLYGRRVVVKTIHEESENELELILAEYARQARIPGQGIIWKKFWGLRESLARVTYGYALTSHRAQGSTIRTVFLDVEDILKNSNRREAASCLYVGSSRPTTKLFIG